MAMTRVMIQLPQELKEKLDDMRDDGYSIAGFIRSIVEKEIQNREKVESLLLDKAR